MQNVPLNLRELEQRFLHGRKKSVKSEDKCFEEAEQPDEMTPTLGCNVHKDKYY